MNKVMVTLRLPTPLSLDQIQEKFGLTGGEIDKDFGVVEIDPREHLYTVLVGPTAASKLGRGSGLDYSGPYSNPKIATFELPQS
jgi:hypothetical protein